MVQGTSFGTAQHGLPELFEDIHILKKVQNIAMKIIEEDPKLEKKKNEKLKILIKDKFLKRIEI